MHEVHLVMKKVNGKMVVDSVWESRRDAEKHQNIWGGDKVVTHHVIEKDVIFCYSGK